MKTLATLLIPAAVLMAGCGYFAPRERSVGPSLDGGGVKFMLHAPQAYRVQLAGSWPENNWARGDGAAGEADIGLMSDDDGDGVWEIVVKLPAGRHQYLFWIDEVTWRLDPGNPEEVRGGPQGWASEVVIYDRAGRLEIR